VRLQVCSPNKKAQVCLGLGSDTARNQKGSLMFQYIIELHWWNALIRAKIDTRLLDESLITHH